MTIMVYTCTINKEMLGSNQYSIMDPQLAFIEGRTVTVNENIDLKQQN